MLQRTTLTFGSDFSVVQFLTAWKNRIKQTTKRQGVYKVIGIKFKAAERRHYKSDACRLLLDFWYDIILSRYAYAKTGIAYRPIASSAYTLTFHRWGDSSRSVSVSTFVFVKRYKIVFVGTVGNWFVVCCVVMSVFLQQHRTQVGFQVLQRNSD